MPLTSPPTLTLTSWFYENHVNTFHSCNHNRAVASSMSVSCPGQLVRPGTLSLVWPLTKRALLILLLGEEPPA